MRQDQAGQVHVSAPVPYWGGCTKHGSYEGISSTIIIIIIRFIKFVWESLVFKPNSVHSLATFWSGVIMNIFEPDINDH